MARSLDNRGLVYNIYKQPSIYLIFALVCGANSWINFILKKTKLFERSAWSRLNVIKFAIPLTENKLTIEIFATNLDKHSFIEHNI